MKVYRWAGTCGNLAEHDFREHKKAFVLLCLVLFCMTWGPFTTRPCLLKSSWTNVTFQSLLFCGAWCLPSLCFSQEHSHLPKSPSLSVHPFTQPPPRCGLHVFYVDSYDEVLTEPALDPDGTGVCEKNKIHHSLALGLEQTLTLSP